MFQIQNFKKKNKMTSHLLTNNPIALTQLAYLRSIKNTISDPEFQNQQQQILKNEVNLENFTVRGYVEVIDKIDIFEEELGIGWGLAFLFVKRLI